MERESDSERLCQLSESSGSSPEWSVERDWSREREK